MPFCQPLYAKALLAGATVVCQLALRAAAQIPAVFDLTNDDISLQVRLRNGNAGNDPVGFQTYISSSLGGRITSIAAA